MAEWETKSPEDIVNDVRQLAENMKLDAKHGPKCSDCGTRTHHIVYFGNRMGAYEVPMCEKCQEKQKTKVNHDQH